MTLQRKIKEDALLSLRNHWGRAIGILLFVLGTTVAFWMLEYLFSLLTQITSQNEAALTLDLGSRTLRISSSMAVISATFLVVSFAVLSPLQLGVKKWYWGQVSGETPPLLTVFDYFYNWRQLFRAILLQFSLWVRKAAWAVVFFAPSILLAAVLFMMDRPLYGTEVLLYIALALLLALVTVSMGILWYFVTLRYYLADYLFVTREGMGIGEAIKTSVTAMKGSKRTLFSLQLSLLPWRLTTILLAPLVFVAPYYSASMAIFAKVRLESYFSKISQSEGIPL